MRKRKAWDDYSIREIRLGITEVDRGAAAREMADIYAACEHWMIAVPPGNVRGFVNHLPPALCEHATFWADGGVATLMRLEIPVGGLIVAGAFRDEAPITMVVTLPKEYVSREAIERFVGEEIPANVTRYDIVVLRDEPDRVAWPTMLLDAVMIADPHMGQEILNTMEPE